MKRNNLEHEQQAAFFKIVRMARDRWPMLGLVRAIPNGGQRHIGTAKRLKAEGVDAGTPDVAIWIPSSDGKFPGSFIEFKVVPNVLTASQKEFRDLAISQGYDYFVAYDWAEAVMYLEQYLEVRFFPAAWVK